MKFNVLEIQENFENYIDKKDTTLSVYFFFYLSFPKNCIHQRLSQMFPIKLQKTFSKDAAASMHDKCFLCGLCPIIHSLIIFPPFYMFFFIRPNFAYCDLRVPFFSLFRISEYSGSGGSFTVCSSPVRNRYYLWIS
jgi:hypothetical protein